MTTAPMLRTLLAAALVLLAFAVPAAAAGKVGGPFALTDHTGRAVTDRDFHGRFVLLYFGYTYCPDVCPTSLSDMSEAIELLGPDGDRVQPLFITVDPERDTLEMLADYVGLFHPRLLALRGTPKQTEEVARAFHAFYTPYVDHAIGGYQLDHTAHVYLVGPDGNYLTYFPYGYPPEMIAREVSSLMAPEPGRVRAAIRR
jgi:cytochrome oxidase Cu insertion factor (SCO1/SenC/PrrC family)